MNIFNLKTRNFSRAAVAALVFVLARIKRLTGRRGKCHVFALKRSGFIPARDLNSSVLKGIWWMPWQLEAMKDVAGCDKLWLGVNTR